MSERLSFWEKIKARHLESDVYAITAFTVVFIVSTWLYYYHPINSELFGEFQLAVSTSLLATIFISCVDFYTKYHSFEKAEFIENLYKFGIRNLYFSKQDVLTRHIDQAQKTIWISGYRLILTERVAENLHYARKRGVDIKMLLCPPWAYAHELVYPDVEETVNRYIRLMSMISDHDDEGAGDVSIRFTMKPLFNDTYRCDDVIITSPYMHNRDLTYRVMTAADFFTYEVERDSKLFELLDSEYTVLYEDAMYEITMEDMKAALNEIAAHRRTLDYYDKASILTDHVRTIAQLEM